MKHKHYDLIVLWAEDPRNRPVQYKSYSGHWIDTIPTWNEGTDFRFRPPVDCNGRELVTGKMYQLKTGSWSSLKSLTKTQDIGLQV